MKTRTKKRYIYKMYDNRETSPKTSGKKGFKLAELLTKMSPQLPMDEDWDKMSPVGREFGSSDYERLAQLDALTGAAKAAYDAMKVSRSGKMDQALFSKMHKRSHS